MKGRTARAEATHTITLTPLKEQCEQCGQPLWVGYHAHRTVTRLDGLWKLRVVVRRCVQPECPRYHVAYRPEEEGSWALPHGEFGLEVIALIGSWRYCEHRSVPEMHRLLLSRGVSITERSVTHLMQRYEELVTLRLTDHERIKTRLQKQDHVILALDGLQPDVGHEVLWVVRDCLSEEILLARPRLSSTQGDLTALLTEVKDQLEDLEVPVKGVISDGEETIGKAVSFVFADVPHQLCQFHYLKDATKLLYDADRHAKTELKKHLRGVRPIERADISNRAYPTIKPSGATVWRCVHHSPMMVVPPCSLRGSSSLIASRRSMIPLLVSKKKKDLPHTKAIAASPRQGIASDSTAVAALAALLRTGASGHSHSRQ